MAAVGGGEPEEAVVVFIVFVFSKFGGIAFELLVVSDFALGTEKHLEDVGGGASGFSRDLTADESLQGERQGSTNLFGSFEVSADLRDFGEESGVRGGSLSRFFDLHRFRLGFVGEAERGVGGTGGLRAAASRGGEVLAARDSLSGKGAKEIHGLKPF